MNPQQQQNDDYIASILGGDVSQPQDSEQQPTLPMQLQPTKRQSNDDYIASILEGESTGNDLNDTSVTPQDTMGDHAQIDPTKTTTEQKTELAPEDEEWGFGDYVGDMIKGGIRGVPSAVAELAQTIGDIDKASYEYLGTLNFEDKGKKGFDLMDLFQIPDYISPSEYKQLKQQYGEEIKNAPLLYKTSNKIDELRDNAVTALGFETAETESVLGGLTEGITQFATGYGITGKLTKLGNHGYKNLFLKEAIVGAAFFDPEETLMTDLGVSFLDGVFDTNMSEYIARQDDDSLAVKRLKGA